MTIRQPLTGSDRVEQRSDKDKAMALDKPRRSVRDWQRLVLRIVGAGLLIATAAIHLDLYLTGYRTIPTIGWLFLLQVIAGFVLGLIVLATGSRLAAAAGAGFALATLGGYLLSLWIGLFGFREVHTSVGVEAAIVEIVAFAVLAALALDPGVQRQPVGAAAHGAGWVDRLQTGLPLARWMIATFSVIAAVLLGVALGTTGPATTNLSSTALLKVANIHGAMVLTNAKGFTLYWFAPDSPTKSTCYGTCAAYWPPVTGKPVAGAGVTGTLGTIKRSDGQTQVTYDRHPLYTYVGDSAPGQASGNNINLNGGLWFEIKASG
jgi:predicted lipoprotein with Yx(FWY)xxD motif